MASIGLSINLTMANSAALYGWQVTPTFVHPDQMATLKSSEYKLTNMTIDPDLGVLMLSPTYTKQDTNITDWTLSSVIPWRQGTDTETRLKNICYINSAQGGTFSATTTTDVLAANDPFYITLSRGTAAPGTSSVSYDVDTIIEIAGNSSSGDVAKDATPENGYPLRLYLYGSKPPFLQYGSPDGNGGWTWAEYGTNGVQGTKVTKCDDLFNQTSRKVWIAFMPFPDLNAVLVDIGNGQERLLLRGQGTIPSYVNQAIKYVDAPNISVAAGNVKVSGTSGTCDIQYLPITWPTTGKFLYNNLQLDFVFQGNYVLDLANATFPPGCTQTAKVFTNDNTGINLSYEIDITNPSGTRTPLIPSAYLTIPPVYENVSVTEVVQFNESQISELHETETLKENTYEDGEGSGLIGWSIEKNVGVRFNNSSGMFTGAGGTHVAVQYARGLTIYDGATGKMVPLDPANPYVTFLTGYTGERTSIGRADPVRQFDLVLEGKDWPLKRVSGGIQRYGDGMCYQAYMRYQAELSGIDPKYISQNPYCGFGSCPYVANPPGCTHFKLPLGTAQNPAMSFPPQQKFWTNILRIAGLVHEVVMFDRYGVLCRFPYLDYVNTYSPRIGTFTTKDGDDPTQSNFLMGIQGDLHLSADTINRRTGVMLVGIDPNTNIRKVATRFADTVMGAGWAEQVHGFRENEIVASRLFTTADSINTISASLLGKSLLPNIRASWNAHFLPNVSALDIINVEETQFVIGGILPVIIENISRTYINTGSQIHLGSSFEGRWLSNA